MFPLASGWRLFYRREHMGVTPEMLGQLCIVKIANDGPLLVKQLRRGFKSGRFNLVSSNAAPLEDVELDWGTKVLAMEPPN